MGRVLKHRILEYNPASRSNYNRNLPVCMNEIGDKLYGYVDDEEILMNTKKKRVWTIIDKSNPRFIRVNNGLYTTTIHVTDLFMYKGAIVR